MAVQIFSFVIGSNLTEIHKHVLDKYVTPSFGSKTGDPNYDPRVDLNEDGVINMLDTIQFSRDPGLTLQTFNVTPLLWWQVALPLGLGLVGVAAIVTFRKPVLALLKKR